MLISKLPFEKFLSLLRESGKEQGFVLLVMFIAREADCPHIFDQLESSWASLHDLTDTKVLFSTIDGTSYFPIEENGGYVPRENVGSIEGALGGVMYSSQVRLLQNLKTYKVDYKDVKPWSMEPDDFMASVIAPTRRPAEWRDNQTLGISAILKHLDLVEEVDIPCLYFESLFGMKKFQVPVGLLDTSQTSVYSLLRTTLLTIGDSISELQEKHSSISTLEEQVKVLEKEHRTIYQDRPSIKFRKILDSKEWLENWLCSQSSLEPEVESFIEKSLVGKTDVIEVYSSIKSLRQILDKHSFRQLRAHLNRMATFDCGDAELVQSELAVRSAIRAKELEAKSLLDKIDKLRDEIRIQAMYIDDQLEHVIVKALKDAESKIKQKDERRMTEESKRVIYTEKYFENVKDGYHEHNYAQNQDLTKAANDIKTLLDQLTQSYPNSTEPVIVSTIESEIRRNPTLRSRLTNALRSGGIEALKSIFDHPFVNVPVETIKGFLEAEAE